MLRHLLTLAVFAFWTFMMGRLLERESLFRGGTAADPGPAPALRAGDFRMRLLRRGTPIGNLRWEVAPAAAGFTATLNGRARFDVTRDILGGGRIPETTAEVEISARLALDRGQRLDHFKTTLRLQGAERPLLSAWGRVQTDRILLRLSTPDGSSIEHAVPFNPKIRLLTTLSHENRFPRGKEGDRFTVQFLNPFTAQVQRAEVEVGPEEELLLSGGPARGRRYNVSHGSLSLSTWVAPDGEILRQDLPFRLTLEKDTGP